MRPGRPTDLPAMVLLWRAEVRAGRRDSVPREEDLKGLLAHFDWGARSRLVEDGASKLAGAVLVTSTQMTAGIVARVDPAADGEDSETVMRDLVLWSLNLSRAAGAVAVQVWVGPGRGNIL